MKTEQKKSWFRRHKIWTGIISLFVLFVIIGSCSTDTKKEDKIKYQCADNTFVSDSADCPKVEPEIEKVKVIKEETVKEEIKYGKTMSAYLILFGKNTKLDSETISEFGYGIISASECSTFFKGSTKNYKTIKQKLNNMIVPNKVKAVHQHIVKALMYMEEATSFLAKDCGDEKLLDQALTKIYLANDEMNKGNALLNQILIETNINNIKG